MRNVQVSIITVCRNSEDAIGRTIESVLNQSYDNIEYIIVDGLSEDKTVVRAESYRSAFEARGCSFRLISERDGGIYDAMNKGTALAAGELVGIINSGDWYEPQAVQRVVEIYEKTGFDLFYADLRIYKRTGSMIKKARLPGRITTKDWNHPTTFIRRSVYDKFHYACCGLCDDLDLVMRIQGSGCKVTVLNEVLANFSFGGVSSSKSLAAVVERIREKSRVYRKNGFGPLYVIECILVEFAKYILS